MEFEKNKPVSDADRHLADAKRLTLQPIHADIAPEAPLDSEIASRHINEPAIANIANDTEESTSYIRPAESPMSAQPDAKQQTRKLVISLAVGISLFTSLAIVALLK